MNIRAFPTFLLTVALLGQNVHTDLKGYSSTHWGMTIQEVKKILKIPIRQGTGIDNREYLQGEIEIENAKMTISYDFGNNEKPLLESVVMYYYSQAPNELENQYNRIYYALCNKYGNPIVNRPFRSSWVFKSTIIWLRKWSESVELSYDPPVPDNL